MNWKRIDNRLKKDGWHIQVTRHHDEWRALFFSITELPASGKGKTIDEAVTKAYELIKGRTHEQ